MTTVYAIPYVAPHTPTQSREIRASAMVTYGGDEVSAVVLDVGTSTTRAGYAGEDTPRTVTPTSYGYHAGGGEQQDGMQVDDTTTKTKNDPRYYIGDAAGPSVYRPGMTVHSPLRDGVIEDWAAMERIVEHALKNQMRLSSLEEHPLLISEPSWQSKDNRERWTELAFEGMGCPAFYSVDKSVLTSFSVGKGTSLVLDVGEEVSSCVPVYDGFVIRKGIQKSPLSGSLLTSYLSSLLRSSSPSTPIQPHYLLSSRGPSVPPNTPSRSTVREDRLTGGTESFRRYAEGNVLAGFKESVLQVYGGPYDEISASQRPTKLFEFPDGYSTYFGAIRYRIPEVMFNPSSFLPPEFLSSPSFSSSSSATIPTPPLSAAVPIHQLIHSALKATDVDLHPTLLQNIVVVGGTTLLPGFLDRLSWELSRLQGIGNARPKIEAPGTLVGRKYSSWLGGSILGSLGTFHSLWIGREEYMEVGKNVIHRRAR